jgi:hypothetical protein
MKISLTTTFLIVTAILLVFLMIFGGRVHAQPYPPVKENRTEGKSSTQMQDKTKISQPFFREFTTELESGIWKNYIIGPSSFNGAYVIDITPLEPSLDGAHVEYKLLPVYDGEQWNDVLSMIFPEQADSLKVKVRVHTTVDWPVIFQATLKLEPGDWQGYPLKDASLAGGYIIEINPTQPAELGATLENAVVQPEFVIGKWCNVLRVKILDDQKVLEVQVRVYRTPDLPVAEFDTRLEPGVWHGFVVGQSSGTAGYLIGVTPLEKMDGYIERAVVQPEFDGHHWNDVARVMIPADQLALNVHIWVYAVQSNSK